MNIKLEIFIFLTNNLRISLELKKDKENLFKQYRKLRSFLQEFESSLLSSCSCPSQVPSYSVVAQKSRCVIFIMYLDVVSIKMYSKKYVFEFSKTSCNLKGNGVSSKPSSSLTQRSSKGTHTDARVCLAFFKTSIFSKKNLTCMKY